MEKATKTRARIEILNWIICFSTSNRYGDHASHVGGIENSFEGGMFDKAPIGSLVKLGSAPFSKWYLSWVIDTRNNGNEYLLESIEDGSLCWWGNVSVNPYNPETVKKFPQWRWTDAQFAFSDRWQRACKRRGAYMVLPMLPVFHEDGSVTLGCRLRYEGLPGRRQRPAPKKFDNWKKVKVKDMLAYYDEAKAEDEQRAKKIA